MHVIIRNKSEGIVFITIIRIQVVDLRDCFNHVKYAPPEGEDLVIHGWRTLVLHEVLQGFHVGIFEESIVPSSVRVTAVVTDHVCTFQPGVPKLFECVGLNIIPPLPAVLIVSFQCIEFVPVR